MSSPAVTVVMAAYNRGNIIRHAIDSVLRQTLTDWELLVMGDACTDDTGDVVTSVADPRVTFINLPENSGDQATPNNAGCARARGRYIAFLNQDDFWLPDHLSRSVAALDAVGPGGAEMVFGLLIQITAPGHWYVWGPSPSGRYELSLNVPASSWVFRRELVDRIGPWLPARACVNLPSQDWIQRAWRAGVRIDALPGMSCVAITSAGRKDSYGRRLSAEHDALAIRLRAPDAETHLMTELAYRLALESHASPASLAVRPHVARAIKNVIWRAAIACGVSPVTLANRLRYWRRGGAIDHYRRVRGLDPVVSRQQGEHR